MFELDFDDRPGVMPDQRSHSPKKTNIYWLNRVKYDEGICLKDGHYVMPLPFRNSDVVMPNSRDQSVKWATWQKQNVP